MGSVVYGPVVARILLPGQALTVGGFRLSTRLNGGHRRRIIQCPARRQDRSALQHEECLCTSASGGTMLELFQCLSQHAGARWIKADLHVHTPASHDFRWNGLSRETFTPQDYAKAMQAAELDLVAIVDHVTAGWVDDMKRAARDLKKHRRLGVLPGVEVSVGGIHLVLIFPEEFAQEHIEHILSKLDIAPDDRGKSDTVCTTKTVIEVIQIVHDQQGLVVGAHCQSERTGIVRAMTGQSRTQALELIDAVELK